MCQAHRTYDLVKSILFQNKTKNNIIKRKERIISTKYGEYA